MIGDTIDPVATGKLYAPFQKSEPYAGVTVTRDQKYADGDRNRLDIFQPATTGARRPVLIFVHGGAFIGGDKHVPYSPFYDNIMLWAVANGMIGLNMSYRLAPKSPWPAGVEDVASAVAWAKANVADRGGDPDRIFLMGHSAGATHAATYVAQPEFHKVPGGGIAGAILLSGLYELDAEVNFPAERAYYGDDLSKWHERSPLAGLVTAKTPLLVMHGDLDPTVFIAQSDRLNKALCEGGTCPTYVVLRGHSHMSEVYAINSPDTAVTEPIGAFVGRVR